jgi:phosphoglycolate phosphatase
MDAIRHIVWDWNGTLLDDIGACVETINRMLRRRTLPLLDANRYREIFGFPVRDCYLVLGFDLEREDWDAVAREFHANYAEASQSAGLRPGTVAALERFRRYGVPMSILSASPRDLLDAELLRFHMRDTFQHVYGLGDIYASSKIELGRLLLDDIRFPPGNILLVGDTTHDHAVARELGWQCVLVGGGHQSEEKLRRCDCPVLTDTVALAEWMEQAVCPPPVVSQG